MENNLIDILPSIANSIMHEKNPQKSHLPLPNSKKVIIILVDGFGYHNLLEATAYTPFIRENLNNILQLKTVLPSTTSCALVSFSTSLPPGLTGVLGYKQLNPNTDEIINFLSGTNFENMPPLLEKDKQKYKTDFTQFKDFGIRSASVLETSFKNSFLTKLYCSGSDIFSGNRTRNRVNKSIELIKEYDLVYLYYSKIDRRGHGFGVYSDAWFDAVSEFDAYLQKIYREAEPDTLICFTADHGMINKDKNKQYDIAEHAALLDNIKCIGGEPRILYLYLNDLEKLDSTLSKWKEFFGDSVQILKRDEFVEYAYGNKINKKYLSSIGEIIAICKDQTTIIDSRIVHPNAKLMIGLHGSDSEIETSIPLFAIKK
jgi:predicted AlkP superfamily pyrophosphatase or phosphodiesterase